MARQVIWGIFGLLFVAGAQMHTSGGGEVANAEEGSDIVRLKGLAVTFGNEEELGDMGKEQEKLVMGRNVTFEISGFSVEREELVTGEEHEGEDEEEVEEDHGELEIKEEDWAEEAFIEGVKRSVLDHCNLNSIKSTRQ